MFRQGIVSNFHELNRSKLLFKDTYFESYAILASDMAVVGSENINKLTKGVCIFGKFLTCIRHQIIRDFRVVYIKRYQFQAVHNHHIRRVLCRILTDFFKGTITINYYLIFFSLFVNNFFISFL